MKIGGPKPPTTPPQINDAGKAGGADGSSASRAGGAAKAGVQSFSEVLGAQGTPKESNAVQDASLQGIATRIQSGELGAPEASKEIVDVIVERRGAGLTPPAREQLREALMLAMEQDPHLAVKLAQMVPTKLEDNEA
ncbi:MAG: hypothetical protein JRH20_11610 [Deltaproteobacteria bacterium]|nr:hypothetical protein [Deltaproteobacteria bacterium]